jgi:SAM-dependent methyltransferase
MSGECAEPHIPADDASTLARGGERARNTGDPVGEWVEIDTTKPSVSRVYNFLLGGSHNFAADRIAAGELLAREPLAGFYAQANREFLWRAVWFLLDAGVRQFIDLGSGIPAVGNVHEVAQRVAPKARVVYVDIDPIVVEHNRHILNGNAYATAIRVDLRRPEVVVNHPATRRLIDLAAPVGLLAVAVLHFIPDADDPAAILSRYRRLLAPGSFLAMSHACGRSRYSPGPRSRNSPSWPR